MSVSIIIPNLHSPLIGQVIAALRAQTAAADICEIIVVGMDRHGLVAPDALVQLIDTGRPISPAAARNRGAAAASGDYVLFVDADCLLAPEALDRLLAAARAGYGAVVGAVVPETEQYWVLCNNLMAFPEFLTLDQPGERDCLPSFCLLIARAVWDAVGAFDERFPGPAGEDLDLSFRMRQAGYRLACAPAAAVRHRPARPGPGAVWRQHVGFGTAWHALYHRYRDILPFSQAVWLIDELGGRGLAAALPIACLYVLRLFARRRHLLRFWYAIPGMIWAQFGWYNGIFQAASLARAAGEPQVGAKRS
ncbi:MAG TPA: glycosyltransferase [Roseiflexaceae bacterium]